MSVDAHARRLTTPTSGGTESLVERAAGARRRRHPDRRRRAAPADPGRRVPVPDRTCRRGRLADGRPDEPAAEPAAATAGRASMTAILAADRRPTARRSPTRSSDLAQPQADPADPGAGRLRDPAVGHVRAAVRVRVRRRDPAARRRSYKEYLMPGIFAQTLAFALGDRPASGSPTTCRKGWSTGSGRCRWPRSAFLTGRTIADVVYNAGILVVLMARPAWSSAGGSGTAVLRVRSPASVSLLLFAYAMSWLMALSRPAQPTVETAQQRRVHRRSSRSRSSPTRSCRCESLPSCAATVRRVEPGEHADRVHARAVRQPQPGQRDAFPSEHPILMTVVWCAAFVVIFAPLAVRRYRDISK